MTYRETPTKDIVPVSKKQKEKINFMCRLFGHKPAWEMPVSVYLLKIHQNNSWKYKIDTHYLIDIDNEPVKRYVSPGISSFCERCDRVVFIPITKLSYVDFEIGKHGALWRLMKSDHTLWFGLEDYQENLTRIYVRDYINIKENILLSVEECQALIPKPVARQWFGGKQYVLIEESISHEEDLFFNLKTLQFKRINKKPTT